MTPNHSTVNLAHAFASWKVPKSYTARLLGQRNNSFIATAASSRIVAAKNFHVLLQRRRAIFPFIFGPSMPQIRGNPPFFYHVYSLGILVGAASSAITCIPALVPP